MKEAVKVLISVTLLGATATGAVAQRDPAYQNARESGLVGEKADGYLGFVSAPSPAIKALVDDINIKRKAAYAKEASTNGATIEEMAFRNGCRLIGERTVAGEKYQTPTGQWMTRDGSRPALDARCP